ncbi:NAD(P)-binding domain-containing protein [Dactylosporangium sp. CA-139066]|uniref:NAD(P)-binding domain-containing protein n=1 Tax=Dactylosporangium sp. CA-139066 TaxID=3239930 RepID=UPI003D8C3BB1
MARARARRREGDDRSMPTIGLIGSGNIGSTVARLAIAAGHDVVLSNSRGPGTLQDLVSERAPRRVPRGAEADAQASRGPLRRRRQGRRRRLHR